MAYAQMTVAAPLNENEKDQLIWEYQETVTGAITPGTSIILPAGCFSCGVTVVFGSGSCKLQATTDKISNIIADSATWVDAESGTLTASFQDVVAVGASAVRLYSISGSSVIKVSAK